MEKKAKIIATLGPAIYKETKLKQLVNLGVDAFRINFSHNTNGISKIVTKIRTIEKLIEFVAKHIFERSSFYQLSHHIIITNDKSIDQISKEIILAVNQK